MLGFSAGAHLTAATSTNFDKRAYEPIDAVDQVSCRPDFQVVIYPGGVLAKNTDASAVDHVSPEITVTKDTPPAFICQANNDPVNPENSVYYYLALQKAGINSRAFISTRPAATDSGMRPERQTLRGVAAAAVRNG